MDASFYERDCDRIRIFFEIFYISRDFQDAAHPERLKCLQSETLLQKMDFLLRNPDYLCLLLMTREENSSDEKLEIKDIVKAIYREHEPEIRRDEMDRFFFGAYEPLDDVIAFLVSMNLVDFESIRNKDGAPSFKSYYILPAAMTLMQYNPTDYPSLQWYTDRCKLLKRFFGSYSGAKVRQLQYQVDEYANTKLTEPIRAVNEKVYDCYKKEYGESLC